MYKYLHNISFSVVASSSPHSTKCSFDSWGNRLGRADWCHSRFLGVRLELCHSRLVWHVVCRFQVQPNVSTSGADAMYCLIMNWNWVVVIVICEKWKYVYGLAASNLFWVSAASERSVLSDPSLLLLWSNTANCIRGTAGRHFLEYSVHLLSSPIPGKWNYGVAKNDQIHVRSVRYANMSF